MVTLAEIKEQNPSLQALTDKELISEIKKVHYPDISLSKVKEVFGYQEEASLATPIKAIGQEVEKLAPNLIGGTATLLQTRLDPLADKNEDIVKIEKTKVLQGLEEWSKQYKSLIPISDKEKESFWLYTVPSAFGSTARFAVEALVFKGASLPAMGADIFGETYRDISIEHPEWDDKKRIGYSAMQAVPQAILERWGTNIILDPFLNTGKRSIKDLVLKGSLYKGFASNVAKTYVTEAVQEGSQQMASNVVDKLYKLDRGLFDGVLESALVGGIVGGTVGGAGSIFQAQPVKQFHAELEARGFTQGEIKELNRVFSKQMNQEIELNPEGFTEALGVLNKMKEANSLDGKAREKALDRLKSQGMKEADAIDVVSNINNMDILNLQDELFELENEETIAEYKELKNLRVLDIASVSNITIEEAESALNLNEAMIKAHALVQGKTMADILRTYKFVKGEEYNDTIDNMVKNVNEKVDVDITDAVMRFTRQETERQSNTLGYWIGKRVEYEGVTGKLKVDEEGNIEIGEYRLGTKDQNADITELGIKPREVSFKITEEKNNDVIDIAGTKYKIKDKFQKKILSKLIVADENGKEKGYSNKKFIDDVEIARGKKEVDKQQVKSKEEELYEEWIADELLEKLTQVNPDETYLLNLTIGKFYDKATQGVLDAIENNKEVSEKNLLITIDKLNDSYQLLKKGNYKSKEAKTLEKILLNQMEVLRNEYSKQGTSSIVTKRGTVGSFKDFSVSVKEYVRSIQEKEVEAEVARYLPTEESRLRAEQSQSNPIQMVKDMFLGEVKATVNKDGKRIKKFHKKAIYVPEADMSDWKLVKQKFGIMEFTTDKNKGVGIETIASEFGLFYQNREMTEQELFALLDSTDRPMNRQELREQAEKNIKDSIEEQRTKTAEYIAKQDKLKNDWFNAVRKDKEIATSVYKSSPDDVINGLHEYGITDVTDEYYISLLEEAEKVVGKTNELFQREIETIRELQKQEQEIKQEGDPLIAEARKYDSAEEFVRAQGETLYHGTNAEFENFDKSKIGTQSDDGIFGRGFYFAKNKNMAENAPYGEKAKIVKEVLLNIENPLNISEFKTKKELADYLDMSEDSLTEGSMGIIRPLNSQIRQFTSKVKEKGHDGVYVNRGGVGDEVVAFEPSQIKTKQQLTEIWNKSQELKQRSNELFQREVSIEDMSLIEEGYLFKKAEEEVSKIKITERPDDPWINEQIPKFNILLKDENIVRLAEKAIERQNIAKGIEFGRGAGRSGLVSSETRAFNLLDKALKEKGSSIDAMRLVLYMTRSGRFDEGIIRRKMAQALVAKWKSESPKKGSELYSKRTGVTKGSFVELTDGTRLIKLFEGADIGTLIHELSHSWASMMTEKQLKPIMDMAGIKTLSRVQKRRLIDGKTKFISDYEIVQETFADAFTDNYMYEGIAPVPEAQSLFDQFKDWLVSLYENIGRVKMELSPEVKAMFNSLLSDGWIAENKKNIKTTNEAIELYQKEIEDIKIKREDLISKIRKGTSHKGDVRANTRELIRQVQQELVDYINTFSFSQDEKGIFISNLKRTLSEKSLQREIKKVTDKAKARIEQRLRQNYKSLIEKEVSRKFMVKAGQQNKGKYDYETNTFFKNIKAYSRLTKVEAEQMLDSLNTNEATDNISRTEREFLFYKAYPEQASIEIMKDLLSNLKFIRAEGIASKTEDDFIARANRNKIVDEVVTAMKENKLARNALTRFLTAEYAKGMGNIKTFLSATVGKDIADKLNTEYEESKKETGIFETEESMKASIKEIYGLKSDFEYGKKMVDLSKEEYEIKDNKNVPEKLSIFKIMHIYLGVQNEKVRNKYNYFFADQSTEVYGELDVELPKQIVDVLNLLTEEDIAFADMLQEIVQSYYDEFNAVHIRTHGVDLGRPENYFPMRSETEQELYDDIKRQGETVSAEKDRQGFTKPIPSNAFHLADKYIRDAEHKINISEKYVELKKIINSNHAVALDKDNSTTLKRYMTELYGEFAYNTLNNLVDSISLNQNIQVENSMEKYFGWLLTNWTVAKIASPMVGMKQVTATTNYMEAMPAGQWLGGLTKTLANPKGTVDYMFNHPLVGAFLKERFNVGNNEALIQILKEADYKGLLSSKWTRLMTLSTRTGDIVSVIFGGKPYLDYLEKNYTPEEAKKLFIEQTLGTMQSGLQSSTSLFQQKAKGSPFVRAYTVFFNTNMQYMRKWVDASYQLYRGEITTQQFMKVATNYLLIQPALFTALGLLSKALIYGDDFEEQDWASELLISIMVSPFGGIPIFIDLLRAGARKVTGKKVWEIFNTGVMGDMEDLFRPLLKKEYTVEDMYKQLAISAELTTKAPATWVKRTVEKNISRFSE